MPVRDASFWSEHLKAALGRYEEVLIRKVASRLVRPRNQWPIEELIQRCLETLNNPVVLDRRLAEVSGSARQLLAAVGHSRVPQWPLGNLVEVSMALGNSDGLAPVLELLEAGLVFPVSGAPGGRKLVTFSHWLGTVGQDSLAVFSPPQVSGRALATDLGLPDLTTEQPTLLASSLLESDGLEWLLRLGALWQLAAESPLRRTQQGGLFKRDVDRLTQQGSIVNSPPPDRLAEVPDVGFWLTEMALVEGLLTECDGELRVGTLPAHWEGGLWSAIESLWSGLFAVRNWTPLEGWRGGEEVVGHPYPSAYLLTMLLLARAKPESWIHPADLESWLREHHPYWKGEEVRPSRQQPWLEKFLLGLAYPMRLVQVCKNVQGESLVRLTPVARWLLGQGERPTAPPVFPKTLLVQPNLEMIAYRQGLTPSLIAWLTKIATWKTLGAACTLQLEPQTVYRALELGETFDSICQTLAQYGTRAVPPTVLDSLRTWSNKRDRITIYPTAALLEFNTAEDLTEALARGVPLIRLSDTLAVVASEDQIEFRHFRLTGTRDYALPPDRCVSVEDDGVTLTVDLARSDLMLETELPRFADLVERGATSGRRQYRLTAASLARAREAGMTLTSLQTWFQQRTGESISPAARLLLTAAQLPPPRLRRHLVLHVDDEEVADGLLQWPATSELFDERLGPKTLSILEDNLPALKQRLGELGVQLAME